MLEVCIDNLESAANALQGGADELEICSSLKDGGLTPSPGLVIEVIKLVKKTKHELFSKMHISTCSHCDESCDNEGPKVNIMIRCRGGSNFCFNESEMNTMLSDIDYFKTLSIDRFVFGALDDKNDVDKKNCAIVIARAQPFPVTFHRAFDLCQEPEDNLSTIINLGFTRVLTSGQRPSADEDTAKAFIKRLYTLYGESIEVMPGAGISSKNALIYVRLGCDLLHSSCKVVKQLPITRPDLGMGPCEIYVTDSNIVKNIKDIIQY